MIKDDGKMPVSPQLDCHVAGRQEEGLPEVTGKTGGIAKGRPGGPWSPLCRAAPELPRGRPLLWVPPVWHAVVEMQNWGSQLSPI